MKRYMVALATALFLCGCSSDDADTSEPVVQPLAIHFDTSLRDVGETRATYPDPDWAGTMTLDRLKVTTYGVFAQHTSNTTWTGHPAHIPGNVSVSFRGAMGETLLHRLDLMGIIVSTGSACDSKNTQISHVLKAMEIPESYALGTIRVSFGRENNVEDAEIIAKAIGEIIRSMSN